MPCRVPLQKNCRQFPTIPRNSRRLNESRQLIAGPLLERENLLFVDVAEVARADSHSLRHPPPLADDRAPATAHEGDAEEIDGENPIGRSHVGRQSGRMDDLNDITTPGEAPEIPSEPAPPIDSRFLFVDVAALRAKQLRRGARPRVVAEEGPLPHKAERLAMEEVRRGLVYYDVPPPKSPLTWIEVEPEAESLKLPLLVKVLPWPPRSRPPVQSTVPLLMSVCPSKS